MSKLDTVYTRKIDAKGISLPYFVSWLNFKQSVFKAVFLCLPNVCFILTYMANKVLYKPYCRLLALVEHEFHVKAKGKKNNKFLLFLFLSNNPIIRSVENQEIRGFYSTHKEWFYNNKKLHASSWCLQMPNFPLPY